MKPLRLELEGFTSFREKLALDFSGLDLFAITGPTGAGKSSLIDAIVFALYGQVPRVGDDYKQLISHGAERLSVLFDFAVGQALYRVARTARRSGPSQQALERLGLKGPEPLAGRVREIRERVEGILGLDYDGFTRSVVLPQGQFDAFLKGEPKERQKILVALLSLGVYERMLQLANQKGAAARGEAEFIRQQIATDYADATAEALADLRAERTAAEAEAKQAEAALAALAEGVELAQAVRAHRRDADAVARDLAQEEQALAAAQTALAAAEEARAGLEVDLGLLRRQIDGLGFDEARLAALLAAKPLAEQLASRRPQAERLERAQAERQQARQAKTTALAAAEAALPEAEGAEAEARARLDAAQGAREAAHREHAAATLRRQLRPGEPCPVCEQTVRTVPSAVAPVLDAAETQVREAEAAARAGADRLQKRRLAIGRLGAEAEALERELAQLEDQRLEAESFVGRLTATLREAGFAEADAAGAEGLVTRIKDELQALEAARRARREIESRQKEAEQRLSRLQAEAAGVSARRDAARGRLEALASRRQETARRLDDARKAFEVRAAREGWELTPLPPGRDEVDVLESGRAGEQRRSAELAGRVATLRNAVTLIEQKIGRAAELADRRTRLEADAALLKTLADHLKANELVAWIQEEALRRLGEEGSRHLTKLSQGRYELRLGSGEASEPGARADRDFFIVDHWNADGVRSVKTLSGGETFLASLALALALAESLAQLSAGGQAGEALESLFLDEGFGTLDAETLDVVVSALDALHGGQRVVGVVTHVRELAERLPARLEVRRQGATAVATIV
jgi:exonuclease SbcC